MNATMAVAPAKAASTPRADTEDSLWRCDPGDPFMCGGNCKTEIKQVCHATREELVMQKWARFIYLTTNIWLGLGLNLRGASTTGI